GGVVGVDDDAERGRAVVERAGHLGRGPALGLVALVGIDGRGEEKRQLAAVAQQPAEKLAEVGRAGVGPGVPEAASPLLPDADVNVATAAGLAGEDLGHEAEALAVLRGDLLGPLLDADGPVGHR